MLEYNSKNSVDMEENVKIHFKRYMRIRNPKNGSNLPTHCFKF